MEKVFHQKWKIAHRSTLNSFCLLLYHRHVVVMVFASLSSPRAVIKWLSPSSSKITQHSLTAVEVTPLLSTTPMRWTRWQEGPSTIDGFVVWCVFEFRQWTKGRYANALPHLEFSPSQFNSNFNTTKTKQNKTNPPCYTNTWSRLSPQLC